MVSQETSCCWVHLATGTWGVWGQEWNGVMQLGLTEQVAFLSSGWGSSCRPAGKAWKQGRCAGMLRGLVLKLLNL